MDSTILGVQSLKYDNKSSSIGYAGDREIFHVLTWLYMISFFILPDGFGFRLGFLFSAKRIMMFVCYGFIIFSNYRLNKFFDLLKKLTIPNTLVCIYLIPRIITAVYRTDINTFAGEFLDGIMVFYLFAYLLTYEITFKDVQKMMKITLMILIVAGILEYITGINVFSYLNFAGHSGWNDANIRSGEHRVSGNCHHAIHYGIYITILFFMQCYDEKKNRLFLFKNPLLFFFTLLCVFFSGSRGPLGLFFLGAVLIIVFSNVSDRITSIFVLLGLAGIFTIFVLAVYNTSIGRQIMYMITATIDGVFKTEYALQYTDTILKWSTEYREALSKVFDVWYFNKFIGRGVSYELSVVIDGYWLQSCDNSYVSTYISLAYPGLAVLIGYFITILSYSIKGLAKYKSKLYAIVFTCVVYYVVNIWYVAFMGTLMYIWLLFAIIVVDFMKVRKNENEQ